MSLSAVIFEVQKILDIKESIDPNSTLSELGFDSLNIVELILVFESFYPNFDFNASFIFHETATLSEIYNKISSSS